jgi:hypothetical protein
MPQATASYYPTLRGLGDDLFCRTEQLAQSRFVY